MTAPAGKSADEPSDRACTTGPRPTAGRVSIALEEMGLPYDDDPGEHRDRRAVQAGLPGHQPQQPHAGHRRSRTVPDGQPISVFESGAILQYLARRTGQFYGATERDRVDIDQWLMWQMGGLGPMAGQTHHFRQYAALDRQPTSARSPTAPSATPTRPTACTACSTSSWTGRDFICGQLSIADFACWPWIVPWKNQGIILEEFPNLKAWFERVGAREAVQKGFKLGAELRTQACKRRKSGRRSPKSPVWTARPLTRCIRWFTASNHPQQIVNGVRHS
jgi:GST-like protein